MVDKKKLREQLGRNLVVERIVADEQMKGFTRRQAIRRVLTMGAVGVGAFVLGDTVGPIKALPSQGTLTMRDDYVEFEGIAAPTNPASGYGRVFLDVADDRLKIRTSDGYSRALQDEIWASEFAASGSGTNADPWPTQAIIDEIQYIIDAGEPAPGVSLINCGVFRGTPDIAFDTNAKNASNIIVQGGGMGGWESDGFGRYWGRGTTIDYIGTGEAMRFGSAAMANVFRLQLRDFTLIGSGSAASAIELENCYRNILQNITIYGFSQPLTTTWGVHSKNSFSGRFVGLFFHNNFNGIFLEHTVNNGFQADLGFLEVDGFGNMESANDRYGIKLRGCLSATGFKGFFVVNVVNLGAGDAVGIHLTSCKGTGILSPYVEGGVNSSYLTDIGIQVDNSQSITLITPGVTKIGTYGLYAFGNVKPPVAIQPQFGFDSGVDSTGVAIQGSWTILGDPVFLAEWTGTKYAVGSGIVLVNRDFTASLSPPQFGNGDTTPSVGGDGFWETNNSGATTITDFDDGVEGRTLEIFFADANTTIQHGAGVIELKSGANYTGGVGDILKLRHRDGVWYETNGLTA